MIPSRTLSVVAALALLTLGTMTPAEAADDDEIGLSGKFGLGYLATSGNTDTATLNTKLELGWEALSWRHSASLGVVRAEDSGVLKTERYTASAKSDYKFNEFDYMFVTANYDRDEFAGYSRRTSEAVGYGRRLIHSDAHLLEAEAGFGARQNTPVVGASSSETIVRLAGKYQWKFSDTADFEQKLVVEKGGDNTFVQSDSSVRAALTGSLALKVSYLIKSNSDVPLGKEKTDTATAISIEYAF